MSAVAKKMKHALSSLTAAVLVSLVIGTILVLSGTFGYTKVLAPIEPAIQIFVEMLGQTLVIVWVVPAALCFGSMYACCWIIQRIQKANEPVEKEKPRIPAGHIVM